MPTPLDPFVRLGQIARELGHELEFQLVSFIVVPDLDEEHHGVRCLYRVSLDHLGRTDEQRETDATLQAMLDATTDAEQRAEREAEVLRQRQQVERLAERLRDPNGGIL